MSNKKFENMTIGTKRYLKKNFFVALSIFLSASVAVTSDAAPLESLEKTKTNEETSASNLPSRKSQEEVGNPSELAWQAWLLVDGNSNSQNSGILDSASLLRRITPKSIFIAPALTACAEGYQADTMNRCVKDPVTIDTNAHRGFLVERLNAIFANVGKPQFSQSSLSSSSSSSSSSSVSSGPLQLNIPLLMTGSLKPIEETPKSDQETSKPVRETLKLRQDEKVPDNEKIGSSTELISMIPQEQYFDREKISDDAIVTVYELDEASKENEDSFILRNRSTGINDRDVETTSTRLENDENFEKIDDKFVKDSRKNLSSIDYKITKDSTNMKNVTDHFDKYGNDDTSNDDNEESPPPPPTLVLLLSPTKLPSSPISGSNDVIVSQNSSLGRVIIKMENLTGNVTGKEIIRVSVPESIRKSSIKINEKTSNLENSTINTKIHETEIISDDKIHDSSIIDDNYDQRETDDESTEIYDEDDTNYEESTESDDEILKHSEAGIGFTSIGNNEKLITKRPFSMIFNNVSVTSDKKLNDSSDITSVVSVNRDFVRETTLVDIKTSKLENSTSVVTSVPINMSEETTTISTELENSEFLVESLNDTRNEKFDLTKEKIDEIIVNGSRDDKNLTLLSNSMKNSTFNDNSRIDTSSNDNSKIVEQSSVDKEEKIIETIYPVRGIEEALEDSFLVENSSTEKIDSSETMMAASTNLDGAIISSEQTKFQSNDEKRNLQPFRFPGTTKTTKEPSKTISSSSSIINEGRVYDYEIPYRDYPSNRQILSSPMKDSNYRSDVNYDLTSGVVGNNFFTDSRRNEDYVRFPNYNSNGIGRVRFPYDEVNSISNDYKERNRRPYVNRDDTAIYNGDRRNTGNNFSPDILHRKETYGWSANEWRDDRREPDVYVHRSRTPIEQRSRDRGPMLLRFWTRMPLVQDPGMFYPTRPRPIDRRRQIDADIDGKSLRRNDYHVGTSNRDVSRNFPRDKSSIGD